MIPRVFNLVKIDRGMGVIIWVSTSCPHYQLKLFQPKLYLSLCFTTENCVLLIISRNSANKAVVSNSPTTPDAMMTPKRKLFWCLISNVFILTVVIVLIVVFRDPDSKYFRWGPHDDLIVVSVKINTLSKYFTLVAIIVSVKIVEVLVHEIGMPVLGFSVYNPDKKIITDFTKNKLQFYANAMFMVSSIRQVLLVVVSVTQIDIALISCCISEITAIFTVRLLLNEKKFVKTDEKKEEQEEDVFLLYS